MPVIELATEWALVSGAPMPVERIRDVLEKVSSRGRHAGHVGAWAAVAGLDVELEPHLGAVPYEAMCERDWRAAAEAFAEVGWSYDRALMLSLLDDEESLVEAIEVARALGAEPLTKRVAGRMRELGLTVPHGPRESTRANPAGLTARQLEVLVAARRRPHERRDRRPPRRLAAHGRAPRRRRAHEARRLVAAGRGTARVGARAPHAGERRDAASAAAPRHPWLHAG